MSLLAGEKPYSARFRALVFVVKNKVQRTPCTFASPIRMFSLWSSRDMTGPSSKSCPKTLLLRERELRNGGDSRLNLGRGDGYEKKSDAVLSHPRSGAQPAFTDTLPVAAGSADRLPSICALCSLPHIGRTHQYYSESTIGAKPQAATRMIQPGLMLLSRPIGWRVREVRPSCFRHGQSAYQRFAIKDEGYFPGQYLDTSGVNHDHSLTENAGRFLNPIGGPGAGFTCGFAVNDNKNMAEANVNSTNNLGPTHSPSDPGGELTTFHPPGSIDMGDLNDFGGIVDSCLNVGSSLINDNLSHLGGDAADISPQGDVAPGAETTQNLGEGHPVIQ